MWRDKKYGYIYGKCNTCGEIELVKAIDIGEDSELYMALTEKCEDIGLNKNGKEITLKDLEEVCERIYYDD
jgi:hypothetical protein